MLTNFANRTNAIRAGLLGLALGLAAFAPAQELDGKGQSPLTRGMGITQNLGTQVPLETKFKDDDGKPIKFGEVFHGRPVLLIPIFYNCMTGCPLVTDNVMKTLARANKAKNELLVGKDLDVVMVSIHPKETPELANAKKQRILNALEPPNAAPDWRERTSANWHLLTGDLDSIHKVTDAVGFKYKYDAAKNLINHPTCTVLLTPEGKVSSYTIGNDFETRVIKEDLAIASHNEIGVKADQTMMFGCIMLDPATHKWRPVVENIMRVAGILTIIGMAISVMLMNRSTKRDERLRALQAEENSKGADR